MGTILQTESTLTDRYQTTIPEPVREVLRLGKRDKITYVIEESGKVMISRTSEDDPVLTQFLSFLVNDIKNNPSHVHSVSSALLERARSLVSDVEVDLDAPLSEQDA